MCYSHQLLVLCFFHAPPPTEIYTLSLHDALPIWGVRRLEAWQTAATRAAADPAVAATGRGHRPWPGPAGRLRLMAERSEEHTSELQSRRDLVCRLLLEKKKKSATTDYAEATLT